MRFSKVRGGVFGCLVRDLEVLIFHMVSYVTLTFSKKFTLLPHPLEVETLRFLGGSKDHTTESSRSSGGFF